MHNETDFIYTKVIDRFPNEMATLRKIPYRFFLFFVIFCSVGLTTETHRWLLLDPVPAPLPRLSRRHGLALSPLSPRPGKLMRVVMPFVRGV